MTFNQNNYRNLLLSALPKIIETEEEYDRALSQVEPLFFNKNRTPEETALYLLLTLLIKEYEEKNYPMPDSTPLEMLKHLMEARDLRQCDLVDVIGSKGVVSEVLNGKRSISKAQAKTLGEFFHVSPALFI